jgi:hypothetical protein
MDRDRLRRIWIGWKVIVTREEAIGLIGDSAAVLPIDGTTIRLSDPMPSWPIKLLVYPFVCIGSIMVFLAMIMFMMDAADDGLVFIACALTIFLCGYFLSRDYSLDKQKERQVKAKVGQVNLDRKLSELLGTSSKTRAQKVKYDWSAGSAPYRRRSSSHGFFKLMWKIAIMPWRILWFFITLPFKILAGIGFIMIIDSFLKKILD